MENDSQMKDKAGAKKIISKLWPEIVVDGSNEHNLTPDVVEYVYQVYLTAKQGDNMIKSLQPALGITPATGLMRFTSKIFQAVNIYLDDDNRDNDWGMATKTAVKMHSEHIKAALVYGTEVFPLDFGKIKLHK